MRGRTDRLWMIGGALGAVVLLGIGWFLFISPKKAQTSRLQNQLAATEVRQTVLQQRLGDLRRQNSRMPQYLAQLARDRQALPMTSNLSNFLRELQAAGDSTGVSVTGLLVGAPTQVTVAGKQVFSLQIGLTATGTAAHLNLFLDQLQQVQPRAVLISSANAVSVGQAGTLAGTVTLTLSLQAFIAPPKGAETAPSSTTTTTTS